VSRAVEPGPRERPRAWLLLLVPVALVVGLLAFRNDATPARRHPAPRALASPGVAAGSVGGLLPDATLRGRVTPQQARALRPGIVMLVAPECRCVTAVRQVVAEAARYGLVTYLVESGESLRQVEVLAAQAGGDVGPFADPAGALARAYGLSSDAALVLVRADGVVTQVVGAVGPSLRLGTALRALL
jgi:hypothetical protein